MVAGKFLPKPIRRVLTSRVEVATDKGDNVGGISKPLLVARPEKEQTAAGSRQ